MRKEWRGRIINVSSLAGRIGLPLASAYVSSKFALEGLSESYIHTLQDFGISVILIEPGVIKTNFINNLKIGKQVITSENGSINSSANSFKNLTLMQNLTNGLLSSKITWRT